MYFYLLTFHSLFRWLVLVALLLSIYRAGIGYLRDKPFSSTDNTLRHGTATIVHIQLIIGVILYFKSPIVRYLWSDASEVAGPTDTAFFGLVHFGLMLLSVVLVTVGSALAKRKPTDRQKFSTMLVWFTVALLIIAIAIPWPFSPFAQRPYFRPF